MPSVEPLNLSPAGIAVIAALLPLTATAALSARFVDKRQKRLPVTTDDWLLLAGLVLLWTLAIVCFVGVALSALGAHSLPPTPSDPPYLTIHRGPADAAAEHIVLAFSLLEKPTFALIKASALLSYRRIFPHPALRRACLALLLLVAALALAFAVAAALQCRMWNWLSWYEAWARGARCAQAELVWVGYSVADVATDVAVLGTPVPALLGMHLTRARKAATLGVFALGGLGIAVGAARMVFLLLWTYAGTRGFRDLLALQSTVLVLSLVEASVAVVAACLPAVRSLVFRDGEGRGRSVFGGSEGSGAGAEGFALPSSMALRVLSPLRTTFPPEATVGREEAGGKSAGVEMESGVASPGMRMRDGWTRLQSLSSRGS